ncbi:hypothetical protein K2173_003760 [Erythroxylum novogranatense]|uniref:Uncharacterized protein n=1 Tax=Erythroxylum novogranatense TaxID=1862640 RepID=A0AAV8SIQ5_9ROSI|nr:hypothetical protein K2173_003760 [Erythroxylum novogranatense]
MCKRSKPPLITTSKQSLSVHPKSQKAPKAINFFFLPPQYPRDPSTLIKSTYRRYPVVVQKDYSGGDRERGRRTAWIDPSIEWH